MITTDRMLPTVPWYALSANEAVDDLNTDPDHGLSHDDVQRRVAEYGANVIPAEPPPTPWQMAKGQLANPMNVMLLVVSVASFVIGYTFFTLSRRRFADEV